ncbi:MAG: RHS repeat protein, partial [Clostridiales bacterium]|nr:RHS repeat protein [Clostridiales bacterium]
TSVAIELVCDAKSGTLYWSCPQVESGRMANAFNLVTDGDFSLTTNNTAASTTRLFPKQWKVTGAGVSTSTLNCIVTDRAVNGMPDSVSGNAMRLTCKPSATDVYIAQEINARGAKGDVFTVSGWCNSLSVASGYSTFQPRIGVRFRTDAGNVYSGWQRFNFSTNRSGWNCISAQVAAPKDFYSIQIGVFYGRNANTGMFSHISLTRELYGNVYTYDANGNVTAVKDLSNQKSAATYDSFDNLLSYVQPGSATTEKYLFTYGSADAEKKAERRRRIEIFLHMMEEQKECAGFEPGAFVALVDKVIIQRDGRMEFCFRSGMKCEYSQQTPIKT